MKIFTSLCLVAAISLLMSMPVLVARRPARHASLATRQAYAHALFGCGAGIIASLVGAGIGSAMIVRKARLEYQQASLQNMKLLVEGSLRDQSREPGGASD